MMLEEGEIDEDFEMAPSLNVNTSTSPSSLTQPSPTPSDHSSSSKSSYTKRKNRHKSQTNKRKKIDHQNNHLTESQDKDERIGLSNWSAPDTTIITQQISTPISLFDLFKQSEQNNNDSYLNPVITEKENSKPKTQQRKTQPLLSLPQEYQEIKRKTLLAEPDESEMTVSVESIEKKMEKKRKYAEIQKERQKKEVEKQQMLQEKREKIPCQFFMSGRCQKGDKCPFSHQSPKKYELCKFYANGYCSKLDKCFFMHSEFPCKFYHRGQCSQGDKCRFSHEPITNQQLQEAFDKYLNETSHDGPVSKPSLLGTPSVGLLPTPCEPVPLMKIPIKTDVDERDLPSGDIDLRAFNSLGEFERLKKELIEKIMKNLSEKDNPEMPKTVLAELLVKLVNTDNTELAKTLTLDALKALLTTLDKNTHEMKEENFDVKNEPEVEDKLELQIDEVKEEEEYEEENEPEVIEGHCGEFEWKLFEIEIEPSSLWSNPPKENYFEPDQECDPRIKYYSNKTNCNNVANYHLKIQQQNLQNQKTEIANASPVYSEPVKQPIQSAPLQTIQKPVRVDPRLAARNPQQSSPPPIQENPIDLLNRPVKDNSLLSSLPDIQLPKDLKNTLMNISYPSVDLNQGSGTKLSIEDYKRKLQKPSTGTGQSPSSFQFKNNREEEPREEQEPKSLLPNIPSYTINLQAPQSLHELLRNIQS